MPDALRTRIAAALKSYGLVDQYGDPLPDEELFDLADAVIRELTIWIPPIFASAIHAWADSELAAISHHGSPGEYEMLKRLNQEAAQIANYATTHERWNGPNA